MRKLERLIKTLNVCVLLLLPVGCVLAATVSDRQEDSIRVEQLLKDAKGRKLTPEGCMLHFARALKDIPYVGHTLDRTDDEQMVINLRELDCTTYVESVLALTRCVIDDRYSFRAYVERLRDIRYRQGILSYENRLHYFCWWAEDNEWMGLVRQVEMPVPPFSAVQRLKINYMSTNFADYAMLRDHPERVKALKALEDQTNGQLVRYIPKSALRQVRLLREVIHNGDIIGIVTKKKNLDTTHLGIAVWHADGLHMLHASSVRKKVLEDPQTLYNYLQKQPYSIGIRIVRVM